LVFTNFAIIMLVAGDPSSSVETFGSIWQILLSSSVAIVLVMSLLYRRLIDVVDELERREAKAHHEALHDTLTGLPNRALLEDRLKHALARHHRDGQQFALLMLDLDRFKRVNDTFGHPTGDLLIQQVAGRLTSVLRETDTIARIGGDEFAILLEATGQAHVRRMCNRIIACIHKPFRLGVRDLSVGVSIGAVLVDDSSPDAFDLVRKADMTMYRAKAEAGNCYRLFSEEIDAAVQRRGQIESKLRAALETGSGLDLHYQPQLDDCGQVRVLEGLLRWSDDELGAIESVEIVAVAEEAGMIGELGEITFRMACSTASKWPDLIVAVNLSPLNFRERDLPSRLRDIAEGFGIACGQIEIELTESLLVEHADAAEGAILKLREHGFRIALDDFGTGYSSLSHLRRFPVDKIKLDPSFIESSRRDRNPAIIRAVVTLAHALNLEVIAEGISSAEHEQLAVQAGCDGFQGYRYAPAMPAAALPGFAALLTGYANMNLRAAQLV
jgi:diguanylate cyclase (GGDEF)-like protein